MYEYGFWYRAGQTAQFMCRWRSVGPSSRLPPETRSQLTAERFTRLHERRNAMIHAGWGGGGEAGTLPLKSNDLTTSRPGITYFPLDPGTQAGAHNPWRELTRQRAHSQSSTYTAEGT
jgi:hypothetical protein